MASVLTALEYPVDPVTRICRQPSEPPFKNQQENGKGYLLGQLGSTGICIFLSVRGLDMSAIFPYEHGKLNNYTGHFRALFLISSWHTVPKTKKDPPKPHDQSGQRSISDLQFFFGAILALFLQMIVGPVA